MAESRTVEGSNCAMEWQVTNWDRFREGVLRNAVKIPSQGSYMIETCQKINSREARHEEKWRHVPTKSEEKIPVYCEVNTRILHILSLMDIFEDNIGSKGCVVNGIEHNWEKKGKNNSIREDGGV